MPTSRSQAQAKKRGRPPGSRQVAGRRKLRKVSPPPESASSESESGSEDEPTVADRRRSTASKQKRINNYPEPVTWPKSLSNSSRGTSRSRKAAADAAKAAAAADGSGDNDEENEDEDGDEEEVMEQDADKNNNEEEDAVFSTADSSRKREHERPRPAGSRSSTRKPSKPKQPKKPKDGAAVFRTGGTESNSDDESTQVFSTEFISTMYVNESEVLNDYKIIADTWKQKYNDPIQIPSGYVPLPQRRACVPKKITPEYELEPFRRSAAYVRYAKTERSDRQSAGLRDLDQLDMVWMELYNKKHRGNKEVQLDVDTMEDMLFEFEQQAYTGALREKSKIEDEGIEHRSDTTCDVCGLLDGEPGNEMVFCDGCDTCVHQICYGVKEIPEGDWFCQSCEMDSRMVMPSCDLCPLQGGALRRTNKKNTFVHVGCALWIPEMTIPANLDTDPIRVDVIDKERRKLLCCLCKTKSGACIQCQVPTCKTAFHVRCAMDHKLRMDLMVKPDGKGEIIRKAFCPRHRNYVAPETVVSSLHDQKANGGAASPSKRIHGARTEFCDLVSLPDVEAELDLPMEMIQSVFAYWVQKRRRMERKPLLRQFVQRKSTVRGPGTPGSRVRASPAQTAIMNTRLSLERARSLCEMVRRRETKKRDFYKVLRSEFATAVQSFSVGLEEEPPETLLSAFWMGDEDSRRERDSARRRRKKQKEDVRTPGRPPTIREKASAVLSQMQVAIDMMRAHPSSGPFWFPVNKSIAPDYYDIIKRPMDLSTMQSKIKNGKYDGLDGFIADFELIASNCRLYNSKESLVYKEFEVLVDIFYGWKLQYVQEEAEEEAEEEAAAANGSAAADGGGAAEKVTGAVSARSLDMPTSGE